MDGVPPAFIAAEVIPLNHMTAAIVLACGCGRIGFDDRGSATDGRDYTVSNDAIPDAPSICHTGAWATPQPIAQTVTSSEESDPSVSPDELTLYFESNRTGGMARAIWMTTRTDRTQPFGTPSYVSELDSAADEHDPSISADGLTIYLASAQSGSDLIYRATRNTLGDPWTGESPIAINGDTVTRSGPNLSADELTLYYAHDLDVAVATRPTRTVDFSFVRLLSEVNVAATDGNPSVTDDGLELFFDSYRGGPNGSIFTASRTDTTAMFGATTELAQLYTSVGGVGAGTPEISADGRTLYFAVDTGTQIDLYTATRACN